jgi:hypothetical protein
MKRFTVMIGAALALAAPAQAETLRISGIYPAGVDEAAALRSIAVEPFGGEDGQRLSFLIEDRLRQVNLHNQPWLAVLVPELGNDADAVLQGFAEPRFAESTYAEQRETCLVRAADGTCTQTGMIEARCRRVSVSLRPNLRLVAQDGRVIWNSEPSRTQDFGWCPKYDDPPQVDSAIDGWLEAIAGETRYALAPYAQSRDIRIMESRSGLPRDMRGGFSAAIRITESDPQAACSAFVDLLAANPANPSLTFNAGLCAEQRGDFAEAERYYGAARLFDTSDDEAGSGLSRISQRRRAEWQMMQRQAQ